MFPRPFPRLSRASLIEKGRIRRHIIQGLRRVRAGESAPGASLPSDQMRTRSWLGPEPSRHAQPLQSTATPVVGVGAGRECWRHPPGRPTVGQRVGPLGLCHVGSPDSRLHAPSSASGHRDRTLTNSLHNPAYVSAHISHCDFGDAFFPGKRCEAPAQLLSVVEERWRPHPGMVRGPALDEQVNRCISPEACPNSITTGYAG